MLYDRQHDLFIVRFEDGETFPGRFLEFLTDQAIDAGNFTGMGALQRCLVAYFNVQTCQYEDIDLDEQMEVLSLIGNIALHEGEPLVHAHVTLGRRDGSVVGGHLRRGIVRPTLEVMLRVGSEPVHRTTDPRYGLPALNLRNRF